MRGTRMFAVVGAGLAVCSVLSLPPAAAAPRAPTVPQSLLLADCERQGPHNAKEPASWAQQRLRFKEAWPLSTGAGVIVGIVDSGVDASHPQLNDQIMGQQDLTGTGPRDCAGHGTSVAGIIAAEDRSREAVPFAGVAPDAKIFSVKQTDTDAASNGAELLAQGIRLATEAGARIINISITADDHPAIEQAVRFAQGRDVVIVAAAGNDEDQNNRQTARYPASYPGVISVAAVDAEGKIAGFSSSNSSVSVAAPGSQIFSTSVEGGYKVVEGTSFAAPYVAGVAALVRAQFPDLNYLQVKKRIEDTADPMTDPRAGSGMVNPVQAVSAILRAELPTEADQQVDPEVQAVPPVDKPVPPDHSTRDLALVIAIVGAAVAGLILAGAVVIPRGRRRGWRPSRRPLPTEPAGL